MPTTWLDLLAPPALPGLLLRAALRHGVRGKALPECGLHSQVMVDPKHFERYRQVCGLRDDGLLSPTYPHTLVSPLQMALLTDKRLPFPLLGLVHLESHIDVLRVFGGLGPFTASVAVENLQPHDKGATLSIVTRPEDQLGLLWVGDSKMLCRGVKVFGEIPPKAGQEPLPLESVSNWKAPVNTGRRYVRVADDYNPIHLPASSAKLFDFPRAIAHGLWNKTHSLVAPSERPPASGYRVKVRFQKPVLLSVSPTLLASVAVADGQLSLRSKDDPPHMAGHWSRLQG